MTAVVLIYLSLPFQEDAMLYLKRSQGDTDVLVEADLSRAYTISRLVCVTAPSSIFQSIVLLTGEGLPAINRDTGRIFLRWNWLTF